MALSTVKWLHRHLNDKNLIILDASLPSKIGGDVTSYQDQFIPGSRKFDYKSAFRDESSQFPNTFPSDEQFEFECQKLGINKESKIIIYDNTGVYSSPRAWWMFTIMGHDNVSVLDGGLPEWIKNGYKTQQNISKEFDHGNFRVFTERKHIISYQEIKKNIDKKAFTIIDARSSGRFHGTSTEPRKNLKSGNIPNSINLPYTKVLADGKYKSIKQLRVLFGYKVESDDALVFSCGSGMTACIVLLACAISFNKSNDVFDGSWTEWAEREELTLP